MDLVSQAVRNVTVADVVLDRARTPDVVGVHVPAVHPPAAVPHSQIPSPPPNASSSTSFLFPVTVAESLRVRSLSFEIPSPAPPLMLPGTCCPNVCAPAADAFDRAYGLPMPRSNRIRSSRLSLL